MSWSSWWHSLHNTLRHEVGSLPIGGGVGGGGDSGEGAGVGVPGVAGEGRGEGAAVPHGEEVEGIRDGDAGGGDMVAMGAGGVGVDGGGDEGV